MLLPEKAAPIADHRHRPAAQPRQLEEIPAVITLAGGDRLVIDRKAKTVIRVSAAGKYISNFATVNAERLARNELRRGRDDRSRLEEHRHRRSRRQDRQPDSGQGHELPVRGPADLAFDGLGHLYVLDGRKAVDPRVRPGAETALLGTIASAGKEAGALQKPRALALDGAGRLYVFDESSQRIQVYQ